MIKSNRFQERMLEQPLSRRYLVLGVVVMIVLLFPWDAGALDQSTTQPQETSAKESAENSPSLNTLMGQNDKGIEKPVVGSNVINMEEAAGNTAKTSVLFIGALLLLASLYKRFSNGTAPDSKLISILERHAVTPKTALLVAEIQSKRYLLSSSADGISLITELDKFDSTLSEALLAVHTEQPLEPSVLANRA